MPDETTTDLRRHLDREGMATWQEAMTLRRRLRRLGDDPSLALLRVAMRDEILRKEISALVDLEVADLLATPGRRPVSRRSVTSTCAAG